MSDRRMTAYVVFADIRLSSDPSGWETKCVVALRSREVAFKVLLALREHELPGKKYWMQTIEVIDMPESFVA